MVEIIALVLKGSDIFKSVAHGIGFSVPGPQCQLNVGWLAEANRTMKELPPVRHQLVLRLPPDRLFVLSFN